MTIQDIFNLVVVRVGRGASAGHYQYERVKNPDSESFIVARVSTSQNMAALRARYLIEGAEGRIPGVILVPTPFNTTPDSTIQRKTARDP